MKYFLVLLLSLFSINCYYHSILPKEYKKIIPSDANKIVLTFDIPKDSLFPLITNILSNNYYRIYNHDKEIGFINTDSKYVGTSMNLRLNLIISEDAGHSKLSCKGEWNLESTNEDDRKWWEADVAPSGFFRRAYEYMVLEMNKFPYKEIQYVKE